MAAFHTRVWTSQLADWKRKTQQIHEIERDSACVLVKTPYVLLLSHPGINVVSAAELAGEMGPIENYATAKSVCVIACIESLQGFPGCVCSDLS